LLPAAIKGAWRHTNGTELAGLYYFVLQPSLKGSTLEVKLVDEG
jgi:hypothetical protein